MSGRAAATVLAAIGVLAAVVAAIVLPALAWPVTADLRGPGGAPVGSRVVIGTVAGRIALAVPVVLVLALVLARRPRGAGAARLWIVGAAAPITVFLVAQANGERDVGALVLTYAAAAAAVLVRALGGDRAWSVAAALGVVPWGVIAFHQVGATLAGGSVPAGARVLTAVVLVATVAEFVQGRRSTGAVLAVLPAALLGAGSFLL